MSASRKRSDNVATSNTLHSFFAKPGKSSPAVPRLRPASSRPNASPKKAKSFPPPNTEVIVIDSDEEVELTAPGPSKGKRKSSTFAEPGSSDIEVLDPPSVPSPKKLRRDIDPTVKCEELGENTGLLASASHSRPTCALTKSDTSSTSPLHSTPSMSPTASMATSASFPGRSYSASPTKTPALQPVEHVLNQAEDVIEIDDEWGMGDDELMDADEDIENVPFANSLESCPECGCKLKGWPSLKIQSHVDTCGGSRSGSVTPRIPTPAPAGRSGANVFNVLMSSHNENEAWKEAQVAEDRTFRATKSSRRKAPFYKVMTGMPIAVDAFRYGAIPGVNAYFLTHAHSDHYTNLSSSWKAGPIYCSEGTANLIIHMLSVDRKWVHPLPMDAPTVIPDTGGVTVTLIEANHCPGSSLFFFEGKQTVDAGDSSIKSPFVGTGRTFRYLHCGDFRASPQHVLHPAVKGRKIDTIYLDTTYLNPKYTFPSQTQVISACAELAQKLVAGEHVSLTGGETGTARTVDTFFSAVTKTEEKPAKILKTLVVVGTYSIGKERVVKAVAKALNTKVYCDSRKAAILRCQQDPELHAMLTKDPYSAGVHLVPLSVITSDRIKEYMDRWKSHWDKIIGFRPTGWTYTPPVGNETLPSVASVVAKQPHREFGPTHLRPMRNSTSTHKLFGVPYSEHSSFYELTCFSLSLDWSRIIATVNVGSESSRGKIAAWVKKWDAERKRRGGAMVPYRSLEYW
ncbi:unnamed protein product [Peniophora sp. CBMAI 1063]|nr:unnamed protein product [Peniophora sp. CBMAI 1063]